MLLEVGRSTTKYRPSKLSSMTLDNKTRFLLSYKKYFHHFHIKQNRSVREFFRLKYQDEKNTIYNELGFELFKKSVIIINKYNVSEVEIKHMQLIP